MDVAIYARLSQEDETEAADGLSGTARQIKDCRDRAAAQGWNVAAIFEDPDHSASDLRRKRPDFERMLAALGAGLRVDAVLCYKLDRLLRHPKEAERIIELADARSVGIVSLNDPGLDLSTPTGRAMFRMTITWAKLETETMSLRIRRKARDMAEAGRPNGGGIRPFGLEVVRDLSGAPLNPFRYAVMEAEAALVREAADRILSGQSLHSVVIDWRDRGIRTPGRSTAPEGRRWEVSSLKRMLIAPRIVGDRENRGAVVGTGGIPPLLDRDTYDRLRAVLAGPLRAAPMRGRRHVLTGVLFCGRCDAKLVGQPDYRNVARYRCPEVRGCGGVSVTAATLEAHIAEAIAIRLDTPDFLAAVAAREQQTDPRDDLAQLRADETALEELARAYFVERSITKAEYAVVRAELSRKIDAGRQRIATASAGSRIHGLAGTDFRAEWSARPLGWRTEVVTAVIDRITVKPSTRGARVFDAGRLDVLWVDDARRGSPAS